MSDPYHDYTERGRIEWEREEAAENQRRNQPVFYERKTMTHFEMTKAAEAVVENLGIRGSICVAADTWVYRNSTMPRSKSIRFRITFVPEIDSIGNCVAEGGAAPESVLLCWTERMRQKYGPKHEPSEAELAATLDAHRAAESAA